VAKVNASEPGCTLEMALVEVQPRPLAWSPCARFVGKSVLRAHLRKIMARAEILAVAPNDNDSHVIVALGRLNVAHDRVQHLVGERVALVGPMKRHVGTSPTGPVRDQMTDIFHRGHSFWFRSVTEIVITPRNTPQQAATYCNGSQRPTRRQIIEGS
jgi:hypothetical protein